MRHVLGYASTSPSRSLLRVYRHKPSLSLGQNSPSTLWICRQCYYHNQRTVSSKTGIERRPTFRWSSGQLSRFSTSSKKLEKRDPINETLKLRDDLPSQEEGRRSRLSKRLFHVMDHLQSNIFIAGQRLNDLTGYSGIEALKKDIEQQG